MVKNKLILFLIFFQLYAFSQNVNLALIHFKDKGIHTSTEIDAPIPKAYFDSIEQFNLHFVNASKWMNIAIYKYDDILTIDSIKQFSFVSEISFGCVKENPNVRVHQNNNKFAIENESEQNSVNQDAYYLAQIKQLKGDFLQNKDLKGQNIKIAVIDNGFPKANEIEGLQAVFNENRLIETYDYYNNQSNVYFNASSNHGTNCFSIIGGQLDSFSGSAPMAKFYLYRTEVDAIEGQTEEVLLSKALEDAVDAGVKVANISLGYNEGFNDGTLNHTYDKLDGKTTTAAKAVNIAASKGILVCVSAGNEGNSNWKYITTPADADSAFTIGAIDLNRNIAGFSSRNLPENNAIKPNVVALGVGVNYLNINNGISSGNGTSYASPIIAGLSACLWQAFPNKTNWEIKTTIEQSADKFYNPDKSYGYGLPNFEKAYQLLSLPVFNNGDKLKVFPNPSSEKINIYLKNENIQSIYLSNYLGQIIYHQEFNSNSAIQNYSISIKDLPNAFYILQIKTNQTKYSKKILKQ